MKKIYVFLIAFISLVINAQEKGHEGVPVDGIIPIKRLENNSTKPSTDKTTNPQTNNITPGTPTGTSTEVGITAGSLSVSLSGGANYNIPIALPPGINDVRPEVNLSYNSQAGNGAAGYGWEVLGISSISRIPSTKFHDGTIDEVDFDSNDRYALDGQRLIKKDAAGVYGGNGVIYQTEIYSNLKITSYGVSPYGASYGPQYFIIEYPNGSKAYYGMTSSSKTEWPISYLENPQGVRISYTYLSSNNYFSIDKIKYGSAGTSTPINEIQFYYGTRSRPEQAYIGGESFIRNKILKEIKVLGNGVAYRNYLLSHNTTSLGYERLISITESIIDNGATKSLNPTKFTYEDTPETTSYVRQSASLTVSNINYFNTGSIAGDFDADGKQDIILFPLTGPDTKKKYWLFNDVIGSESLNIGWEHAIGNFIEIFPTNWLSGNNKLMPNTGWTVVKNNTSTNITTFSTYSTGTTSPIYFQYDKTYEFPKFIYGYSKNPCTSGRNQENKTTEPIDPEEPQEPVWTVIEKIIPKEYLSGDFNGDGLTDVVVVEKPVNYSYTQGCTTYNQTYSGGKSYFVDLDRRLTDNYVNNAGVLTTTANSKFYLIDYNGDGKTDIMVFDTGKVTVYSLNDSKQLVQLFSPYSYSGINIGFPALLGDYNGDGKGDFLMPNGYGTSFTQYLSTGNGFNRTTSNYPFQYYSSESDGNESSTSHLIPIDFNADGKTDIVSVHNWAYTGTQGILDLRHYKNMGSTYIEQIYLSSGLTSTISHYALPVISRFDKSNPKYEINFISNNTIHNFKSQKNNKKDVLLKEITLGNGVKEAITYSNLERSDNGYNNIYEHSGYTENYPSFDILNSATFNLVTKLERQSIAEYKKQEYKYYGAVTSLDGQGFLGFRALMKTNWFNDDHPVISNVSKFDINKKGALTEDYTVLHWDLPWSNYSPTSFISKSLMTYEHQWMPNKVFKIRNNTTIAYNGLEGTSKETTSFFNDNNTPTSIYVNYKHGSNLHRLDGTHFQYDDLTGSPYIIGRVKQKYTESYGSNQMNTEEIYTYDPTHFNLISKIERKNHNVTDGLLSNTITEDIQYNSLGNIEQRTISASDISPRTTSYEYEPSGRFLKKITDIEGLTTEYTYNANNGLLLTELSPFGTTVTYTYDGWGRKKTEQQTPGLTLTYSTSWVDINTFGFVNTAVTGNDNSGNFVLYDDLGRKYGEGVRTINDPSWSGNVSWISYEYDIYNRVIKSSEPKISFFPGIQASDPFNAFSYDDYGRLIETVEHTGKTTSLNYVGLTTSISDGVKNESIKKDATGNIITKVENNVTINYEYYVNGGLKKTICDGSETTISQDAWGRKKQLNDPSAGTFNYTYNSLGELLTENNLNGTITYTLDNFGKLTKRVISGLNTNSTTNYTYKSDSKLIWKINHIDDISQHTLNYNYDYDSYKRLIFKDESGPLGYYQQATLYDNLSRPERELYTSYLVTNNKRSDKWIKNVYKNGYLWKIEDDLMNPGSSGQVLWTTNSVNARGQLTSGKFGNDITVTNTFDQYGFPVQFKHDKSGTNPTNVMTLNTHFDAQRGNLLNRSNSLFNWSENFDYDFFDRLTEFTNEQGQQVSQLYDNKGRIQENTLGTYNYLKPDGKIYQNSSIELTPEGLSHYENRGGIYNEGMESSSGWTIYDPSIITYDSSISHGGSKSLKISNPDTTEKVVHSEIWTPINNTVATEYTYSGWVYSEGPQAEIFLFMKSATETGYFTLVDQVSTNAVNQWVYVEKTIMVPANIKKLNIRLDNNGLGNVWFDDIKIRKGRLPYKDDMEDQNGWLNYEPTAISFDTTFAHNESGNTSLKIVNPTTSEKITATETWFAINNSVDTQYTYSAWVYSDGAQAEMFLYMKDGVDTSDYPTTFSNITSNTTNQWHLVEQTFTVPAGMKYLRLRLDNNGQGTVWFDDVKIKATNESDDIIIRQDIKYNVFKSPTQIKENGVDIIDYTYNAFNGRSSMFYGGEQNDIYARPLRKHFSTDGTMEIKYNPLTDETEFITYIGGDGYSAPVVYKTDGGSVKEFLYLHRDYQGSIMAITNQAGDVVEKRLFDAWGSIIKVQDGAGNILAGLTVLDRGYTGHEHLQSVGLIHMNGRLYDPKLHRFLQPDNNIQDPYNTQNYNRYGYVFNNPLKYIDPTGETGDDVAGPSSTEQVGYGSIFSSIAQNWDEWGIKDWFKDNFSNGVKSAGNWVGNNAKSVGKWFERNFDSLVSDIAKLFGAKGSREVVTVNSPEISAAQNIQAWQNQGFVGSPGVYTSDAVISMPTQHHFLGVNMTALSNGESSLGFAGQALYGVVNTFNIPVQYMMGRSVADGSMRNLNGTSTSTDEGVLSFGSLPLSFLGGNGIASESNAIASGLRTTKDGFLYGSIGIKLPINLNVGLYASENTLLYNSFKWSTIAPRMLSRFNFFGRRMLQITPEFQPTLGTWSNQVIPKGTYIEVGLVGPQGSMGFGTWLQIYAPQAIKYILP